MDSTTTIVETGASNPTVAASSDGRAWIAWVGAEEGASNVWVSRSGDDGSFLPPVRVNDIEGDAAPHEQAPAQIEIGPEGNVYVLWQNNTVVAGRMYPYSNLRLARSTDGGRTFEPAIFVNDDAAGPPASHTFHDIVAGPDGTVWVSWIDSRVRAEQERSLAAAATDSHASHGADDLPGSEIRVARSTDGGRTFGPATVVAGSACPCCRTSLAIADDSTIYLSWRTVLPGNIRDVVVARSDDAGATFTAAQRVNQDDWVFDACPHAGSSLVVDSRGRLHVAWYTGAAERPGIHTAVSDDGGRTFGQPSPILTGEWVPPSQVKLAALPDGRIAVAWDDRRSGTARTRIAFAGPTGTVSDGTAAVEGASPAIAAAGTTAVVAWLDGDAVRAARIDLDVARVAGR